MIAPKHTLRLLRYAPRALATALLLLPASAEEQGEEQYGYANDETVGVEERLGQVVPLDLKFTDDSGKLVTLDEVIDKPTILTLVYLRCPSICSPLMHEVAETVDRVDLKAGEDYQLLTVSFDITDDRELVAKAKAGLLGGMEKKIPEDSWTFLTGEAGAISALTDAVGFRYRREDQDFVHAASVIFLSSEGKIVRYLPGLSILPADLKMAVLDASAGRPRSVMNRLQQLCYSYDPEGRSYALKVNRIILFVTLPGILLFLAYLLFKKKPALQA